MCIDCIVYITFKLVLYKALLRASSVHIPNTKKRKRRKKQISKTKQKEWKQRNMVWKTNLKTEKKKKRKLYVLNFFVFLENLMQGNVNTHSY